MSKIKGFRDRGTAKYFHGRTTTPGKFQKTLAESIESEGGTIFIIQGSPGAGKTALLAKCWELRKNRAGKRQRLTRKTCVTPTSCKKTLGLHAEERVVRAEEEARIDKVRLLQKHLYTLPNVPVNTLRAIFLRHTGFLQEAQSDCPEGQTRDRR